MAEQFRQLCLLLLTPECYDEFFIKFNFLDVPCLKAALSKGLGLGIILGSMLVKVPQITKIFGGKSAEGISAISVFLELFAITANVAYSYTNKFPFSAWGEGLFLALQTSAVAAMVLLYGNQPRTGKKKEAGGSAVQACLFLAVYSVLFLVLTTGITPPDVLWSMQAANVPIILVGKLIQAVANYKAGSTGQLSAVTVFMLFGGSLARIFTSYQETGDMTMIVTYCGASFANSIIAAQVLYYWPRGAAKKEKQHRKKKE
ncbi:mannose-P-dolichol utilization defect 1 protein homolog [Neocloeon triangulifer]|uniref:mannose-P-dolichol utilization defect 1 protein homolog n=1 Tax=Neocloeon triangulifer TaxID=2078957 RepID=UPI00286EF8FA|nr:mannose-P-dolichol utilization defect 1 protein homolog [Neocloeon triangulifer]